MARRRPRRGRSASARRGSTLRTVSLSRDFQALSAVVEPDVTSYLVVFVGDVHQGKVQDGDAKWVLVSFVPNTTSASESKKMAENRSVVKAGLGADHFCGDMWCTSPDQVTLSNYLRTVEGGSASGRQSPGGASNEDANAADKARAASRIQGFARRKSAVGLGDVRESAASGQATVEHPSAALAEATDAVWEERVKGVKNAYVDSCQRLVSSLDELEQTLCALTGDEARRGFR